MNGGKTKRATRSYGLNDPTSFVVEEWPPSKRELYDAARALFWEKGFVETSILDIVTRAGLTKGAFYHYFSAKDDILRVMYERSLERLLRDIEDETRRHATVCATLDAVIRRMVQVANDYRVEVTLFWEQYRRLPESLAAANRERRRSFMHGIMALVERGIASGELSPALQPRVVAMSLIGVCQHSVHWYMPGRGQSLDDMAQSIARLFLEGLRQRVTQEETATHRH
ncbi:MAG: TetR/AcrR family transcriptional regulator [Sphingobium sp.]